MARLAVSEGTPPGTPVYTLQADDPEGSRLHYSISGEHFSVDRDTGVVVLRRQLDHEAQDIIEVIISITDESISGSEPNIFSLRREIAVLDENDNPPAYHGRPYVARVPESAKVGGLLLKAGTITVTDRDGGVNADVKVDCVPASRDDDVCRVFAIATLKLSEGKYDVQITLMEALDYERRNSYLINLVAVDGATDPLKRLQAKATVAIDVLDIQDQPPIFINAPYSGALAENKEANVTVLTIRARDGDTEQPRNLKLELENEADGYFQLEVMREGDVIVGHLITTDVSLDREDPSIMQNGGIYSFDVRATELIDNQTLSDSTVSTVTIIVTDVDDMVPRFSEDLFNLKISEDIGTDTALPGLNMLVTDDDIGENAKYKLVLRDSPNYPGVSKAFAISPEEGQGRVSTIIRTQDSNVLDYDIPGNHELEFEVAASVNDQVVAFSTVHLQLVDANDHSPEFSQEIYRLDVAEDAEIGLKFSDIKAKDVDSGKFSELTYNLRGFGAEKFRTDLKNGGVYVAKALDYETQRSYSLSIEAKDGGGKISSVVLLIEVGDVNDNDPMFEQSDYSRIIRESATSFDPQMFIRAIDIDGPTQGGGRVSYSITDHNSMNDNVFKLHPDTGELTITTPARSGDTERGVYELTTRATDYGSPPRYSEAKVYIRVGVPGNQKPIFRGNFKSTLPGPSAYRARILENAASGTEVIRVMANDPDGRDNLLQYQIRSGAKDNFVINPNSGIITVSPDARLDLEKGGDKYEVVIYAIDSGTPIKETATTTVTVTIVDVNNKSPVFPNSTYTVYVSERASIGEIILKLTAEDPDTDANIEYSIVEPITAVDKAGVALMNNIYDYKTTFRINKTTGVISVNRTLDYQTAAVIIFQVEARDENAVVDKKKQVAHTEVTAYIQAYSDDNPRFINAGWTPNNPTIKLTVPEEQPLGTTLLVLTAKEPQTGYAIQRFELVRGENDEQYVNVGVQSGNVVLNKRIDYETLNEKQIKFKVRAVTRDYEITRRMSEANIIVTVQDVNDNNPIFTQKDYKIAVLESDKPSKVVVTVKATDIDSINTEEERNRGYGIVRYSITGENANYFEIDAVNGSIRIAPNMTLDRERQSVLRMYAIAADTPGGGAAQRTARALIAVDVLDVNDNAPMFPQKSYTAVIPENAPVGVSIINITASDPDEGSGGIIHFEIIDQGEAVGLFKINQTTGEIESKHELTGKGRTEPYLLRIRAQDSGDPPLFTDVMLALYIGDVVSNDGVPLFVRPTFEEIAQIAENSTIGSPVFQVVASDPDDPNLPNGKIMFKFLEDGNFGSDASAFKIDEETGLITTRTLLDRETKDSYTLILVAQDLGEPPQQATRILQVKVLDIDDHKPHFKRSFFSPPIDMNLKEETPIGTKVGVVQAVDEDIGENGMIDYVIVYGNEADLFAIERLANNSALIKSAARIDREVAEKYLLTIKCFKYSTQSVDHVPKPYNKQDPTERQVLVKIIDIDDNRPKFKKDNFTIGVRLNVPIDTHLITLEAEDVDSDALSLNYNIGEILFISNTDHTMTKRSIPPPISLNPKTGEIRTTGSLTVYYDGYMEVSISANNSLVPGRETNVTLRIFMLRDRDMLKFVFSKPPVEVRKKLEEFENAVAKALLLPISVNVYDTQFYAKDDNSLDFSSTSSCFQIVGKETYTLGEMKALLNDPKNEQLKDVYKKFNMERVQNCAVTVARTDASTTQMWVLAIAAFIGVATITASFAICCMHAKYKQQARHSRLRDQPRATLSYVSSAPGLISSGSHTTLGPGTMLSVGSPQEGPYE
ncbi:cadherin EGF LAG seven-pass G-type receptor 3 [Phymastichus coffea]|uniref:cadherin EGF LAG seven-pass G-type receptor 3 n=1 Tax=Phymastichus coffea TaxID=108790 RepID=UPI00273C10EF|nr:cadherin EGF LAG seven-pass G-type receptor 3 [Phymastichus coffea]